MLMYLQTALILFGVLILYFGSGGPEATIKNGQVSDSDAIKLKDMSKKPGFLLTLFIVCLIPIFRWFWVMSLLLSTFIKRRKEE